MKTKELSKLIEKGESKDLEFKEGFCSAQELAKEMCAFANSKGGTILLGVDDSGRKTGIKLKKNIEEHIITIASNNLSPKIIPEISILGDIVKIDISEGRDKPYSANGIYYMRVGSVSRQMDRNELLDMMQKSGRIQFDSQVCEGATLDDIDEEKVIWLLGEARRERGLKIPGDVPVDEALMRLKLTVSGKPTNAAVLLFGRDLQKFFTQSEVKCIRFKGIKPVKPFIDFQVIDGDIFYQVDEAERFVLRNIHKAVWLVQGQVQRQEKYEYPPDAIREALVNAICHRDYYSPSKVQVRVFDDRIEIWNPGVLPEELSLEDLRRRHTSIPRNPLVARQFFWVRYIEEVGTGTNDMIDNCLEWGIPGPEFEHVTGDFVVTFRKAVLTDELLAKLRLNERQKKAIEYLKEYGKIDRKAYCNICSVEKTIAYEELADMIDKGILQREGKGRGTHYILRPIRTITGRLPDDWER